MYLKCGILQFWYVYVCSKSRWCFWESVQIRKRAVKSPHHAMGNTWGIIAFGQNSMGVYLIMNTLNWVRVTCQKNSLIPWMPTKTEFLTEFILMCAWAPSFQCFKATLLCNLSWFSSCRLILSHTTKSSSLKMKTIQKVNKNNTK